jgi:hypothetical protein
MPTYGTNTVRNIPNGKMRVVRIRGALFPGLQNVPLVNLDATTYKRNPSWTEPASEFAWIGREGDTLYALVMRGNLDVPESSAPAGTDCVEVDEVIVGSRRHRVVASRESLS